MKKLIGKESSVWKQITKLDKAIVKSAKEEIERAGFTDLRPPSLLTQWSAKDER